MGETEDNGLREFWAGAQLGVRRCHSLRRVSLPTVSAAANPTLVPRLKQSAVEIAFQSPPSSNTHIMPSAVNVQIIVLCLTALCFCSGGKIRQLQYLIK